MAQRWPSTDTSFPRGVPLGHQVEKKASAPSALYWRATPHEALPCFKKPVSSMTPTACSSASVSSAYSRTMSRNASASHRPQPRIACCRQGLGSPAAAARIQPVLRGSLPKSPSRNCPADPATRFWLNSGRIRTFTSRSDDAHNSKVVSTDAPAIHDLPQSWSTMNSEVQIKCNCNARPKLYPPKTKTGIRDIPIPAELCSVLRAWKLQCPPSELDLVFATPEGKPIRRSNALLYGLWPALRREKLRQVNMHSLRHSYASILIMGGASVTEVCHKLGHSSPK